MKDLIERIKQQAVLLKYEEDSLSLDKALGELECLVHEARQEIDVEWREAREVSRKFVMPKVRYIKHDSEEARQLIADIFKEHEDECPEG